MPQTPLVEKHFMGSEVVREVVIGMSDGLTVPFALAAGLSGIANSTAIFIIGGLAEIAAGSIVKDSPRNLSRFHSRGSACLWVYQRPLYRRMTDPQHDSGRAGRRAGSSRSLGFGQSNFVMWSKDYECE
jgi:hypothetical protein